MHSKSVNRSSNACCICLRDSPLDGEAEARCPEPGWTRGSGHGDENSSFVTCSDESEMGLCIVNQSIDLVP